MSTADSSFRSLFEYDNVILHHVPNAFAPGFEAAMLTYAACLGAVSLEILVHLMYDWDLLVHRSGWREPLKALNRTSYYVCRYGAFVFLSIALFFMTLPGLDCKEYGRIVNMMWFTPMLFVDFIFIQRTLAVYAWDRALSTVLGTTYAVYMGLSLYAVFEFGFGYKIPGSRFCAYEIKSVHEQPYASVFIAYAVMVLFVDTLILALTAHKVTEGGLCNLPNIILYKSTDSANSRDCAHESGEICLRGLLLRQGIGYYLVLEACRFALLIVHYCAANKQATHQTIILGLTCTVGPIMAGILFRQTAEAVKMTTMISSQRSENTMRAVSLEHGRSGSISTATAVPTGGGGGSITIPYTSAVGDTSPPASLSPNSYLSPYSPYDSRKERSLQASVRSLSRGECGWGDVRTPVPRIDRRILMDVEKDARYVYIS